MFKTLAACAVGLVASVAPSNAQPAAAAAPAAASGPVEVWTVFDRYCVTCHNDRLRTAGLALDTLSVEQVGEHAATWERVVRKLRARAMPPAGRPRPDRATYEAVATVLETALDRAAADNPNPGRTATHRLNRTEYANAIRDILGLEVDGRALLPPDDADLGFDNMADILSMSPARLERYLSAARKIARLALGDPAAVPTTETYVVPKLRFQDQRMSEDLPFGSRGGIAIRHHFPLDAEYDIRIRLRRQLYGYIRGLQTPQQIEVRIDGRRVAAFTVGGAPGTPPPQTYTGTVLGDRAWEEYTLHTDDALALRVPVAAGPRLIGVAFVQERTERDGVLQPRATAKTLAIAERWSSPSEAPEAAVEQIGISGPFNATGPGETPSRRRILVCKPARAADEEACAQEVLSTLARRAYRRPLTPPDVDALLALYAAGRREGGFEAGIRRGLEGILVDPEFLFRIERDPVGAAAAEAAPDQRPRARVPPVVLPLEQHPRRRAAGGGRPRAAPRAGRARASGAADAGRLPGAGARGRLRRAVAGGCAACGASCQRPTCFPSSTTTCARRSSRRRSSSSAASCGRTAVCWTCCAPTTRSSTSGSRGTTGFRTCTATGSGG